MAVPTELFIGTPQHVCWCNKCEKWHKPNRFYRSKGVRKSECRECAKKRRNKYYAEHKDERPMWSAFAGHPDSPGFYIIPPKIGILDYQPGDPLPKRTCVCGKWFSLFRMHDSRKYYCSSKCRQLVRRYRVKIYKWIVLLVVLQLALDSVVPVAPVDVEPIAADPLMLGG